jgi:ferredoxin
MNTAAITKIILNFINTSPANTLTLPKNEPAWEEALIGFACASDPVFESYKQHVGEFHFTPIEIFKLTFPDLSVAAEDLSLIAWVLPQREPTKADNRAETFYPSKRWALARIPGEEFNVLLRKHLVAKLTEKGIRAVAPSLSEKWEIVADSKFGRSSRWSERHAAFAAGLGTFGLCDGLITAKGKAHRVGSVVAQAKLEPTPRPYENHRAYCLYFTKGKCMACTKRCPVSAISEDGHDKQKCRRHTLDVCGPYVKNKYKINGGYGCGLCQTKVPCESSIPKGIRHLYKKW